MVSGWAPLCLLFVAAVLAQQDGCVFDSTAEVSQGLDPQSLGAGATYAARLPEVHDDDRCREECCGREDCHLAMIGTPADGRPQCFLVNCVKDGRDVCVLSPSSQFRSYRKSRSPRSDSRALTTPSPSSNSSSTEMCRYQKAVGLCRAAFPRFYYDVTSQTCKQFIYGGCMGNANNFNTQEECEAACTGVTGDVIVSGKTEGVKSQDVTPSQLPEMTSDEFAEKCQAQPEVGPCRASMPRFYYNNGACQKFNFGGCKGNMNNYETEEKCMKTCTVKIVDSKTHDSQEEPDDYHETCVLPAEPGLCRAAFPVFFFDVTSQSCKPFIYGGCGGNQNRYDTAEECASKCAGKQGRGGRARWTPAFFLVATLAIISMVLLVGLLLISSRRARYHMTYTRDDKQELLPEEELPAMEPKLVIH